MLPAAVLSYINRDNAMMDSADLEPVSLETSLSDVASRQSMPVGILKQMKLDIESSHVDMVGATKHSMPYVAEETLLETLRGHNTILSATQETIDRHDESLESARHEMRQLREFLAAAEQSIRKQSEELAGTRHQLIDAKHQTSLLQDRLSTLKNLEHKVCSQDGQIITLQKLANDMDARFTRHFEGTQTSLSKVDIRLGTVEEAVSHLQARVAKLKENLLVPAQNVTLPTELQAGLSENIDDRGSQLTHLLVSFRDQLEIHEADVECQRKMLQDHAIAISSKASIEIETTVSSHSLQLEGVQAKIDADAECHLPSMLAAINEAEKQLIDILNQLKYKVSYEDVDVKVEARFVEILVYLQSALHATETDDDDVRRETSQLQRALNEMRMTKADRGDLAQILSQIASQEVDDTMSANEIMNFKHELDTRPKRAEMLDLLAKKTSFWDLEQSLDAGSRMLERTLNNNFGAIVSREPKLVPLLEFPKKHPLKFSGQCVSCEAPLNHTDQPHNKSRGIKPLYISGVTPTTSVSHNTTCF